MWLLAKCVSHVRFRWFRCLTSTGLWLQDSTWCMHRITVEQHKVRQFCAMLDCSVCSIRMSLSMWRNVENSWVRFLECSCRHLSFIHHRDMNVHFEFVLLHSSDTLGPLFAHHCNKSFRIHVWSGVWIDCDIVHPRKLVSARSQSCLLGFWLA